MLLALVDVVQKVIYINVGCNGRASDGGVFWNSSLLAVINENILIIHSKSRVCNDAIVAGNTLPLKAYLMKLYL